MVNKEGLSGPGELTVFPKPDAGCRDMLKSEQPLLLEGRLDSRSEEGRADNEDEDEEAPREIKMLGTKVALLSEACCVSDAPVCITIPPSHLTEESMFTLRAILEKHSGTVDAEAQIVLDGYQCILQLGQRYNVQPGPHREMALQQGLLAT